MLISSHKRQAKSKLPRSINFSCISVSETFSSASIKQTILTEQIIPALAYRLPTTPCNNGFTLLGTGVNEVSLYQDISGVWTDTGHKLSGVNTSSISFITNTNLFACYNGSVSVYELSDSGFQLKYVVESVSNPSDLQTTMSPDGSTLIWRDASDNDKSVKIYRFTGANYTLQQTLLSDNTRIQDLSPQTSASGSRFSIANPSGNGAATVRYSENTPNYWSSSGAQGSNTFGESAGFFDVDGFKHLTNERADTGAGSAGPHKAIITSQENWDYDPAGFTYQEIELFEDGVISTRPSDSYYPTTLSQDGQFLFGAYTPFTGNGTLNDETRFSLYRLGLDKLYYREAFLDGNRITDLGQTPRNNKWMAYTVYNGSTYDYHFVTGFKDELTFSSVSETETDGDANIKVFDFFESVSSTESKSETTRINYQIEYTSTTSSETDSAGQIQYVRDLSHVSETETDSDATLNFNKHFIATTSSESNSGAILTIPLYFSSISESETESEASIKVFDFFSSVSETESDSSSALNYLREFTATSSSETESEASTSPITSFSAISYIETSSDADLVGWDIFESVSYNETTSEASFLVNPPQNVGVIRRIDPWNKQSSSSSSFTAVRNVTSGANRLFVVSIVGTTQSQSGSNISCSYGGIPMELVVSKPHSYTSTWGFLFVANEEMLAQAPDNLLRITCSPFKTKFDYTTTTFENVSQDISIIPDSYFYEDSSVTTVTTNYSSLPTNALLLEVFATSGTSSATARVTQDSLTSQTILGSNGAAITGTVDSTLSNSTPEDNESKVAPFSNTYLFTNPSNNNTPINLSRILILNPPLVPSSVTGAIDFRSRSFSETESDALIEEPVWFESVSSTETNSITDLSVSIPFNAVSVSESYSENTFNLVSSWNAVTSSETDSISDWIFVIPFEAITSSETDSEASLKTYDFFRSISNTESDSTAQLGGTSNLFISTSESETDSDASVIGSRSFTSASESETESETNWVFNRTFASITESETESETRRVNEKNFGDIVAESETESETLLSRVRSFTSISESETESETDFIPEFGLTSVSYVETESVTDFKRDRNFKPVSYVETTSDADLKIEVNLGLIVSSSETYAETSLTVGRKIPYLDLTITTCKSVETRHVDFKVTKDIVFTNTATISVPIKDGAEIDIGLCEI